MPKEQFLSFFAPLRVSSFCVTGYVYNFPQKARRLLCQNQVEQSNIAG
jgi:hypothetical protein